MTGAEHSGMLRRVRRTADLPQRELAARKAGNPLVRVLRALAYRWGQ